MDHPIRLLIVDDHPALRFGLVALFKRESGFKVVGEASNGIEAIERARSLKPDVILMDIALPKKNGLEAVREILQFDPEIRILIFSSFSDGDQVLAAIKAGAIGYMVKDHSPEEIFYAVRNAFEGKPTLAPVIERNLSHQIQHGGSVLSVPVEALTDREVEILRWIAQGLTDEEIAEKACITRGTVRSHISNLLHKLSLDNRAQVVVYAIRKGLVDLGSA